MLLIDTSNVLHAIGVLPEHLKELDVAQLARLISESRYGRRRAVLVCDGVGPASAAPGAGPMGDDRGNLATTNTAPSGKEIAGLDIVYAGAHQEADDVIELLIARDSAPRRLLVVSTDRRLARAAQRRRAQSITSDAFLRHLAADSEKPKARPLPGYATQVPLNEYAVGYWMSLFGYGSMEGHAPAGERPVADVSKAAQRGLEREREAERSRKLAKSPHAHERLKIPKQLLDAQGATTPTAPQKPQPAEPPTKPAAPPPASPPPGRDELPSDLARLLKDSGLSIDPADLDMTQWLPKDDSSPPSP
jgi:hypothetical protein